MRIRHQAENAEELVATVVEAMDAIKGKDIVTLDLRETGTSVTDFPAVDAQILPTGRALGRC